MAYTDTKTKHFGLHVRGPLATVENFSAYDGRSSGNAYAVDENMEMLDELLYALQGQLELIAGAGSLSILNGGTF
jgi:hypothetical protein